MYLSEILERKDDFINFKASIKEALKKMVQNSLNYLVIVDNEDFPIGIITEKDITSIYFNNIDLNTTVDNHFLKLIVKTSPKRDRNFAISLMIDYQIRRVVLIDESGKYLGVVEHRDLVYSLEREVFKVDLKLRDILDKAKEAILVNKSYKIKDTLELMYAEKKSSVLIFEGDSVIGILTEKDIINIAFLEVKNSSKIERHMHSPVKMVDPDMDILDAIKFMHTNSIRHIVTKNQDKYFVVTPENIIKNLKGNYVKLLEEKIRSHRKSLDDLGYIFIELIDVDNEQVVQYANKNARNILEIDINDSVSEFVPKNIWKKSLEAFEEGKNIELDNVKVGEKYYKYIAVKSKYFNGTYHTINIILIDIDKF